MNKFLVIAALGTTPELRHTPTGMAVLEILLAGERHIVGHDGTPRTLPFYIRSEALGDTAKQLDSRQYKQGDVLLIEGSAEYDEWNSRTVEGAKDTTVRLKPTGYVRKLDGDFQFTQDGGGFTRLMGGTNQLQLLGNLVADVEVNDTTSGPAATLRLAVNERYTTRDGQSKEKTHWFRVSVWREQAEAMRGLTKGTAIYVEGALSDEKWTDREGHERKGKTIEAQVVYAIAPFSGAARTQGQPARTQGQPASTTPRPAPSRAPRAATHERAPTPQVGGADLPPEEADLPF
ncbi:single-stranded DNA-binding protein [Deinococcus sp. Leaf326]|uniref:single-stranded DNA-binding protein n=1 Tax=Deinococcus sp. Leaf326 TaxID=1736338 RepID=UPI0007010AE6|nr:single-stranded DNA-binding protein [Deinococcus sp. Leaf326]KQR35153.1 hypothetical protein ASF71_16360 [Deinococcus sp. Leaf326]